MKGIFLLFTVGFLFKRIAAESPCEDDWIYDPDEKFGKCYYVNTTKVTQVESVRRCEEMGAYLACIATQRETEFIRQMLNESGLAEVKDNQYWIGLYKETITGQRFQDGWVWLDNTPYGWRNWFVGEPDEWERCARLLPHQDWLWGGAHCDSEDDHFRVGYICEKNAHVPSTVAITSKSTSTTTKSTASTTTAPVRSTSGPSQPAKPGASTTTAPVRSTSGPSQPAKPGASTTTAPVRSTSGPSQPAKPGAETGSGESKDNIYIGFGTALGCLCVIFVVVIIIVVWKLRKGWRDFRW